MTDKDTRGIVQVYTGDGKGKTTAALGEAIRATGHGIKVAFIQFVKGEPCGEHLFVSRYHPFDIVQIGTTSSFTTPKEQLASEARQTLLYAKEQMLSGNYDMIVLDEIFVALSMDLITTEQILELLDKRPDSLHLVLTGRKAPVEVVQRADLVTEMLNIKHPISQGTTGIRGIDY